MANLTHMKVQAGKNTDFGHKFKNILVSWTRVSGRICIIALMGCVSDVLRGKIVALKFKHGEYANPATNPGPGQYILQEDEQKKKILKNGPTKRFNS